MSGNRLAVPEAKAALEQFKMEMAQELGYKGDMTSPIDSGYMASYHTGQITRKLVEMAENQLAQNNKKS